MSNGDFQWERSCNSNLRTNQLARLEVQSPKQTTLHVRHSLFCLCIVTQLLRPGVCSYSYMASFVCKMGCFEFPTLDLPLQLPRPSDISGHPGRPLDGRPSNAEESRLQDHPRPSVSAVNHETRVQNEGGTRADATNGRGATGIYYNGSSSRIFHIL